MNRSIHFGTTNIYHLKYACRYGRCEFLKYLIEKGDYPCHRCLYRCTKNGHYDYALILASEYGSIDLVKHLIEQGADIDCALRVASENGHIHIVKYLIENGADIHAEDDYAVRYASI